MFVVAESRRPAVFRSIDHAVWVPAFAGTTALLAARNSAKQPLHRPGAGAVGKHRRQRVVADAEMVMQHALEDGAQIRGGSEVSALVEIGGFQAGPIRDHAAALHGAADQKR